MEKFTLKKYLENLNVPIIDEDGRPVRIMCADFRGLCRGRTDHDYWIGGKT